MKKCYSAGAVALTTGALLLGSAAAASALEIKSGNDKVGLNLYGHIDRAVMVADDGDDSKLFHVDNTHSESRVGLKAKVAASENLTIGGNAEVQWQTNPSDKVSMKEESISGKLKERKMEVYFDINRFGKISVGQGYMASDETSEVDLSGTALAGNSGVADVGGGFTFYDAAAILAATAEDDTEEKSSYMKVSDIFDQMDGLSKRNRLRYDTQNFGGFTLAVSAGEEERADAALLYSGTIGETKLEAALAYVEPGEDKDYTQINGSASVLFGSGLNFTLAGGSRDLDNMPAGGDDPTFMYGKIGYKAKIFSPGATACSVDYGVYENIGNQNTGEEGTAFGVQVVQKISAYNTELFAAWRGFELEDSSDADYEPISIALTGVRLKF
ncbi:MAG: hypothetical protein ACL93V_13210 [Candidatus Electrothrix sp. YB6]